MMDNDKFQDLVLQQFQVITGELQSLKEGQKSLTEGQTRLETRMDKLEESQARLEKSQDILASEVMAIKTDVQKVKSTVIRIEQDHGTRLGALMDGHRQNTEILDRHTEQLDRIENKIESHDIQISVLDKTKANKRKAK